MTPGGGSLHFAVGPAIAFVAVLVLLLLCRWAFGTGRPAAHPVRRTSPPVAAGDAYGLLVPVVTTAARPEAEQTRAVLHAHGIRGTVVPTAEGHEVRVFPDDAGRARALVDEP